MKRVSSLHVSLAALLVALALGGHLQAAEFTPLRTCALMMMGEGGPEHRLILDYQAAALNWGVKLETTTYMNERIVAEELAAGACDLANLSGMQARRFNKFTGTLDSPGSITTYDQLRTVVELLAQPSAARFMKEGAYEVVGIQPGGAIYLYTRDRHIQSISDLAGKKMGILEGMPEIQRIVSQFGMTPVSSTVSNLYQKFNNGVIDVAAGPAIVYGMMELDRGMRPEGGILRAPLQQANLQFIGRCSKLPPGFAQKSREYFAAQFEASLRIILQAENSIPENWWIPIPEGKEDQFDSETRHVRIALRDKGVYDARMLTLLRKVRCQKDPTRSECTSLEAE